tara:strand:- start:47 stop:466 length:420 start_codon:yes stop_codon:yes gene_type:complete
MTFQIVVNQSNIRAFSQKIANLKRMSPKLQKEVSRYMYQKVKGYYRYKQSKFKDPLSHSGPSGSLYRSVKKTNKRISIGDDNTVRTKGKNSPFNYAVAVEKGAPTNIYGGKARIPFDAVGRSMRALNNRFPKLVKEVIK